MFLTWLPSDTEKSSWFIKSPLSISAEIHQLCSMEDRPIVSRRTGFGLKRGASSIDNFQDA